MKYKLGFAIIEWKDGSYSESTISQDKYGKQYFNASNWINLQSYPIEDFEDEIEHIITDFHDIAIFMMDNGCEDLSIWT